MSKKQNLLTKFFAKNKSVESTDHETDQCSSKETFFTRQEKYVTCQSIITTIII
jgi:hypothetical protein